MLFRSLPEELQALLKEYALEPDPNITLVMTHKGGVKGKSLLDSLRKAGAKETPCEAIKRDGDKIQFVRTEALTLNRKISADAAKALVDAVGSDLRELAKQPTPFVLLDRYVEGIEERCVTFNHHHARLVVDILPCPEFSADYAGESNW